MLMVLLRVNIIVRLMLTHVKQKRTYFNTKLGNNTIFFLSCNNYYSNSQLHNST